MLYGMTLQKKLQMAEITNFAVWCSSKGYSNDTIIPIMKKLQKLSIEKCNSVIFHMKKYLQQQEEVA